MKFRPVLRNLFYGCLLVHMPFREASAKEEEIIPPPLVKSAEVAIPPGKPSRVYLRAAGRIVEPMQFLIRKPPKHGTLGEIERVDRNSAVVVYTPRDGRALEDDGFAYAAKTWDSPVSASAVITLHMVETPAVLEAAKELDFGSVFLGEMSWRTLGISNTGGATARGRIAVNPPWRVDGSAEYVIPGGARWEVSLVFEPSDERNFKDRISLGKGGSVQISGSGVPPVSWPKEGLQIRPEARENGVEMDLRNNTATEQEVSFQWPELVKAPKKVPIPPSGRRSIYVGAKAGSEPLWEGEVQATSGNFSFSFPLKVYPAQPQISIASPGGGRLLEEGDDRTATGNFTVSNTGGANLALKMTLPPGMGVSPDPESILLGPGQRQRFSVSLDLRQALTEKGEIFVESPSCSPASLPYEVKRKKTDLLSAARPVEKFLAIPTVGQTVSSNASQSQAVEKIWLLSADAHEVSVVWRETLTAGAFRIERRNTVMDSSGRMAIKWLPWPEVKFGKIGDSVTARFERLPANSRWTIRIIGVDSAGNAGPPSPAFQIATVPSRRFSVPVWAWGLLVAGLIAAAIRLSIDQRRDAHAREDERIAKLEKK
jgi:hypothetical protein